MCRFVLQQLDTGLSRYKLFKLKTNSRCEYDEFRNDIEQAGTFDDELDVVDSVLLRLSKGEDIPPGRFKELPRNRKDNIKDFEVKTNNLRVYLFQGPDGRIIVLGAIKTPKGQQQDIERMRAIKKSFYETFKSDNVAQKNKKREKKIYKKGKRK